MFIYVDIAFIGFYSLMGIRVVVKGVYGWLEFGFLRFGMRAKWVWEGSAVASLDLARIRGT